MEIKRCYDTLIGASVGENQLVQNGDFADGTTGWSGTATLSVSDNVLSVTQNDSSQYVSQNWNKIANHKCFYTADVKATDGIITFNGVLPTITATGAWQTSQTITNITSSGSEYLVVINKDATYPSTWQMRKVMRIDLTALLGSSIADYLYNLETATAGAGVAKLKEWGFFTQGYIPYNAGSLESVEARSHVMIGFNQFDLSRFATEYPQVCSMSNGVLRVQSDGALFDTGVAVDIPAGAYLTAEIRVESAVNIRIHLIYEDGTVQEIPFGSPSDFMKAGDSLRNKRLVAVRLNWSTGGVFYIRNFCINLSSDRNGEYEPYHEYSYDLGTDTLRGLFKLDANNNLYADGDRKTSDGVIQRKYGVRAYQSGDESLADAITDGTNTVYKLATPTTEQSTPFTNPQICDPDGTEEYATSNGVPVGHETRYQL